jgi:hypothetical protein
MCSEIKTNILEIRKYVFEFTISFTNGRGFCVLGSSNRHSNQPRLGVGVMNSAAAYLFEDDSGIMSEVETASTTRFRRASKERSTLPQSGYVPVQPRTSPGNHLDQGGIVSRNKRPTLNLFCKLIAELLIT